MRYDPIAQNAAEKMVCLANPFNLFEWKIFQKTSIPGINMTEKTST